ncbi:MAG TPA: hypothetical protein PLU33_08210 [Treponemataceae bacterium]|nr:hypothetical protein [Treponemataceae bacterium]
MPLNTENESNIPENSDDTTQRLEKYGVWVKKAPHEVKEPKNNIDDNDTTLSLDELSGITSSFDFIEEEPETEEVNLEDFGIQEQEIIEEQEEELPEQSIFNSFDEEINSLISDDIDTIAPKEITDTEEFIIDNGGEDSAGMDTADFSADDILADIVQEDIVQEDIVQEDIVQEDIDFSQFKSFEETYGNSGNTSSKIEEENTEEIFANEDDDSFLHNEAFIEEETVNEESNIETDDTKIDEKNSPSETIDKTEVPEIGEKSSFDDIDFSNFTDGDIDLSAFMDNEPVPSKPVSANSEEIDLDSFMADGSSGGFSDGDIDLSAFMDGAESVHLDNFMPSEKSTVEIVEEPPLNMNLSFDDDFAVETKADPVNDVETIRMDADGGISEFSSFDDMFDSITDENDSITEYSKSDESLSDSSKEHETPVYDDASEFDDLLSSLDETPQVQVSQENTKTKTIISDYDLSVNLEDDVNSVISEKEEIDETDDSEIDDIPLFTGSESGTFYKELEKTPDTGYTISKALEAGSDMEFDELDDLLKEADLVSDNPAEDTISFEEDSLSLSDLQDDNNFNTDNVKDGEVTDTSESEETSGDALSSQETMIDDFDISFDDIDTEDNKQLSSSGSFNSDFIEEEPPAEDMSETIDFSSDDNSFSSEIVEFSSDDDVSSEKTIDIENSADEILESEIAGDNPSSEIVDDSFDSFIIEEDTPIDAIDNEDDGVFEDLENTDNLINENTSEIESEIDIEIPQDTIFQDTNTDDLDDLSQSIPDDFSLDEDIDQELDIQEPIDQEYLEETQEDFVTEQEKSMDADSNPLLDKISQEISILRDEISSLKNELSSLKNLDLKNKEDAAKESGGFFSDDEGDDTIALSGDELNNILINADFTEEYAEPPLSDAADASTGEEILDEQDFAAEDASDEESIIVENASDEEDFTDEPEEDNKQNVELEPFDPFGSVSDVDSISEIEQEDFFEDDTLTIDENLQEPSPEELSIDSIAFTPPEEDIEPSVPSIPNVEDIIVGPSNSDLMESIEEPVEPIIEDTVEIQKIDEDSEDSFDEPTDAVFESSQWDNQPEEDETSDVNQLEETIESYENIEAEPVSDHISEELDETNDRQEQNSAAPVVPKELQQDIKSVLLYMDQLLENLPEDKIEEFARSEHFNVYKKLFTELGLV